MEAPHADSAILPVELPLRYLHQAARLAAGGELMLQRKNGRLPLGVLVAPVSQETAMAALPWTVSRRPVAIVLVSDPETPSGRGQQARHHRRHGANASIEYLRQDRIEATGGTGTSAATEVERAARTTLSRTGALNRSILLLPALSVMKARMSQRPDMPDRGPGEPMWP
jgi:hypothetical protein